MLTAPRLPRIRRWIHKILGPSTPVPDDELPKPSGGLSLSLTLPSSSPSYTSERPKNRSWTIDIDRLAYPFILKLRLHSYWILIPILLLWATANILLVREQYYSPDSPMMIGCTDGLWADWPPDSCGLNGTECAESLEAFGEATMGGRELRVRCNANCQNTPLGNPRWVGDEVVDRVPYVVGGDGFYRADSWICASAIHSSLINPTLGGCLTISWPSFPSWRSNFPGYTSNGIRSTAFAPSFPSFYTLTPSPGPGCLALGPIVTAFNAIMLFLVTIFCLPSPPVLTAILVIMGYIELVLFANPRSTPPDWQWFVSGVPAVLLAGYWQYNVAFKRTLRGFEERPVERALWQGIGFWIGINQANIFTKLPITRLGYGSLGADGAVTLIVILGVVVIIVLRQAWDLRKWGMLRYYIYRYIIAVPILLILAFIPGYTLRFHHFMYSLIAFPVLSLPNRVSLALQAFMLGLFLDGVGRWGWAGLIEQTSSLIGDASTGTPLPEFALNISTPSTLSWAPILANLTSNLGITAFQVVVDDLLRLENYTMPNVTMDQVLGDAWGGGDLNDVEHTFRIAYIANDTTLDFTDPVIRLTDGTWQTAD